MHITVTQKAIMILQPVERKNLNFSPFLKSSLAQFIMVRNVVNLPGLQIMDQFQLNTVWHFMSRVTTQTKKRLLLRVLRK